MKNLLIKKSEVPNSDLPAKSKILNQALIAVYAAVAFLAVANLVGTNALATQGVVLDDLSSKTLALQKQNRQTEVEISHLTNLSYLEGVANSLGYTRIKNPITINQPDTTALLLP